MTHDPTGGGSSQSSSSSSSGGGSNSSQNPPVKQNTTPCPLEAALMAKLMASGEKYDPAKVVAVGERTSDGKLIWLEVGKGGPPKDRPAGLAHILEDHKTDFENVGISEADIPGAVLKAVTEGKQVGFQGKGDGRPIYEVEINGATKFIAVTTGKNGFIVGANPRTSIK